MKKSAAGVIVMLVCAAACGGPAPQEFTTKDAGAIRQQNEALVAAFNAKDTPKVVDLSAENSVFMPPNAPVIRGKDALKIYYDDLFKQGAASLKLDIVEVSGHGPLAYQSGTYEMETKSAAGTAGHDRGKYLYVLRRMGAGWKYQYTMYNSDLPPAGH